MNKEMFERILTRERSARREAENKLEELSSSLYFTSEKLKQTNKSLKNQIAYTNNTLKLLNDFTSKLIKHKSLKAILQEIIDTIISNLNFEDCVIYLVDDSGKYIYQEASFGDKRSETGAVVNPLKIKIGEGITGGVAKSGKARIVRDTSKVPEYICDDKVRYSELTVPIFGVNKKVIGIIDLEHSQKNFFTAEHLQTLSTIANLCSSHLLQATLKEKLEDASFKHKLHKTKFEKVLETVRESIIIFDFNGNITYVNPALERLLGYKLKNVLKTHFLNYIHPEARSEATLNILSFIRHNLKAISFITCLVEKTGRKIWFDVNITTMGNKPIVNQANLDKYIIVGRDITSKLEQDRQLLFQQEKYRNLIANMNLGLLEVDLNHKIIFANDSFCEMSRFHLSELIGKSAESLLIHKGSKQIMIDQNNKRLQGLSDSYEVNIMTKDGEKRTWLISGAPNYNNKKELIGTIGVHLDITNTKKTQEALVLSKLEAERARDAEKEFLANMSHEIRNPLNSILGLTSLLMDTPLSLKQRSYLDDISFSSEILRSLVTDILDLSKLSEGKATVEKKRIVISDLCESHRRLVQYKLDNGPVRLKYDFDDDIPHCIYGDPNMINQVLTNLLTNAVTFTESGFIRFKVVLDYISKLICHISFIIEDTGIGIDDKKKKLVFERFAQAGKVSTNKQNGTGLGLNICKELIELMNGTITLKSTLNKGSTFKVTLPLAYSKSKELFVSSSLLTLNKSKTTDLHALVVEDNEVNIKYLEALLSKVNIKFHSCYNGEEALSFLKKYNYDFILLDIRMPVMDGYETTIWLRSQKSNSNSDIPIIALTASALLDERDRIMSVGANFHLPKPFSEAELISAINTVLENKTVFEETSKSNLLTDLDINLSKIEYIYNNDYGYLTNMLSLFQRTMTKEKDLLEQYFKEEDLKGIKKIAHKIKPNFQLVGLGEYDGYILRLESVNSKDELKVIVPLVLERIDEAINKAKKSHDKLKTLLNIENELSDS